MIAFHTACALIALLKKVSRTFLSIILIDKHRLSIKVRANRILHQG